MNTPRWLSELSRSFKRDATTGAAAALLNRIDFGIARSADTPSLTRTGLLRGKLTSCSMSWRR